VTAAFGLYEPGSSWLHDLDPRVKLLFVAEMVVLLMAVPALPVALGVLLLCHLLLWSAHTPWARIVGLWRLMLLLTILVPLLWLPLLPQETPLLVSFWRLRITLPALRRGLLMAARLDALAFVFFAWLLTTAEWALVQGFVRLGLPFSWGLTLSLSLRNLPTLHAVYLQIVDAQRSRGLDLRSGSLFRRARVRLPILIALMVTALRSSENVGRALESRALGATSVSRSALRQISMRAPDWVCLAALLMLAVAIPVTVHFI
jgi:energy-coupling factor transport system permease protein